MFIITASWLFAKNFRGLAIFPFIFLRDRQLKLNAEIINHERIHLRQQIELLWVGFFLWYGVEFLIRWWQYKNSNLAYLNLSFEREAYQNDHQLDYLKNRKFWNFINYL